MGLNFKRYRFLARDGGDGVVETCHVHLGDGSGVTSGSMTNHPQRGAIGDKSYNSPESRSKIRVDVLDKMCVSKNNTLFALTSPF